MQALDKVYRAAVKPVAHPGGTWLRIVGPGYTLMGVALLTTPSTYWSTRSFAVMFSIFPRWVYGVFWLVAGLVLLWTLVRPTLRTRQSAAVAGAVAQLAWTLGLGSSLFLRPPGALSAFISGAIATMISAAIARVHPLNEQFWGPPPLVSQKLTEAVEAVEEHLLHDTTAGNGPGLSP